MGSIERLQSLYLKHVHMRVVILIQKVIFDTCEGLGLAIFREMHLYNKVWAQGWLWTCDTQRGFIHVTRIYACGLLKRLIDYTSDLH